MQKQDILYKGDALPENVVQTLRYSDNKGEHLAAVIEAAQAYVNNLYGLRTALEAALSQAAQAVKNASKLGHLVRGGAVDDNFALMEVNHFEQARVKLADMIRTRERYLAQLRSELQMLKARV